MTTQRGRSGHRVAKGVGAGAAALLCDALLGACGAAQESPGPERVTVGDIAEPQYFHEGEYLAQRVTVRAVVSKVLDPRSIELAAQAYGEDSLLVQAPAPMAVRVGQTIRATGTVGQYHVFLEEEGYRRCSTTCTRSTRPSPLSTTRRSSRFPLEPGAGATGARSPSRRIGERTSLLRPPPCAMTAPSW